MSRTLPEMKSKAAAQTKPRVLITDNINPSAVELLGDGVEVVYEKSLSAEELAAKIPEMDALMVRSASQVTKEIIQAGRRLKIIGRAGVGTDNIDLAEATQQGIIVVNSPEGNTVAASEHTLGMLLSLARHIPEADASMKAGEWNRSKLTGVEVFGKTLGVIGLGKIGSRVAKACLAMGMRVNVFDPFLSAARADDLGVNAVPIETIWEESDYITIHAPKTRETMNLLNKDTLAKCRAGVRIVNCARGGIINEADLAAAVESGHVAGAALDVFDNEPLDGDSPLLKLGGKVILTPHLGASTKEAQINVAVDVAKQIRDFFKDGYARNAVNLPTLRKEVLDPVRHYMPMAEVLGSLIRQFAKGAAQSVEITAKGTVSQEDISPLTLAVLKGLLSLNREGVNYVNARLIAEELGVSVKESSVKSVEGFQNLLQVTLVTDHRTYQVSGTLIHGDNFRIVDVDGYAVTLEPTEHILFTPHEDKPGMVGLVASILGNEKTNISALQVARRIGSRAAGGESIMIFNLDTPVSENTLAAIRAQAGIIEALYIHL